MSCDARKTTNEVCLNYTQSSKITGCFKRSDYAEISRGIADCACRYPGTTGLLCVWFNHVLLTCRKFQTTGSAQGWSWKPWTWWNHGWCASPRWHASCTDCCAFISMAGRTSMISGLTVSRRTSTPWAGVSWQDINCSHPPLRVSGFTLSFVTAVPSAFPFIPFITIFVCHFECYHSWAVLQIYRLHCRPDHTMAVMWSWVSSIVTSLETPEDWILLIFLF